MNVMNNFVPWARPRKLSRMAKSSTLLYYISSMTSRASKCPVPLQIASAHTYNDTSRAASLRQETSYMFYKGQKLFVPIFTEASFFFPVLSSFVYVKEVAEVETSDSRLQCWLSWTWTTLCPLSVNSDKAAISSHWRLYSPLVDPLGTEKRERFPRVRLSLPPWKKARRKWARTQIHRYKVVDAMVRANEEWDKYITEGQQKHFPSAFCCGEREINWLLVSSKESGSDANFSPFCPLAREKSRLFAGKKFAKEVDENGG